MFYLLFYLFLFLNVKRNRNSFWENGITWILGQYKFQISLYHRDAKETVCGGSLIGLLQVLTAAHCFESQPTNEILVLYFNFYY